MKENKFTMVHINSESDLPTEDDVYYTNKGRLLFSTTNSNFALGIRPEWWLKEIEEERFKKPTTDELIGLAILFNEGKLEEDKLADMLAYAELIVDRLYENGDVKIKCSNEE